MRLLQVVGGDGAMRLGLLDGARLLVLAKPRDGIASTLDLLTAQDELGLDLGSWRRSAQAAGAFEELDSTSVLEGRGAVRLTMPLAPPEVWGAGVTYRRSAEFREGGSGIYDQVYGAARPELFFKASAWRCAGPGQPIGRRRDSTFTACEPELAVVIGRRGAILGYTLANDVSAWDIERENPLYLPQSKIYRGCFAFGPVIVTPDEIEHPEALELSCSVQRAGRETFAGSASTAQMRRPVGELIDWLLRSNEVLAGTVLSSGTGIIQPRAAGLEDGDVVTITCPEIGELRNPVMSV